MYSGQAMRLSSLASGSGKATSETGQRSKL